MKYMGSKSRIKKYIVPIIQELIDKNEIKTYIEPFVGGANVIDSIVCENRIGGDLHDKLIALFEHVQSGGELPLEVPKQLYDDVRSNRNTCKYENWFVGAVGFLASYNGRYFDGGYAKTIVSKTGATRNYYDEAKRNLEQQSPKLQDINFINCDYKSFSDVQGCLIYCDIPYKDTKQFSVSKNFNHDEFWDWVRDMSENNIVIVSELNAPDDFECIWEQPVTRTQDNRKRETSVEKTVCI
jgi:DNA adenine methylase